MGFSKKIKNFLVEQLKAVRTEIECRNGFSLTINDDRNVFGFKKADIEPENRIWFLGKVFRSIFCA